MADIDHAKIVEKLGNSHEQRMLGILKQLEDRIAADIMKAPTDDGKMSDINFAIKARAGIRQAFNETYSTEVDSMIREYTQVAESMGDMWAEYDAVFDVPPEVISELQSQTFQGFQDIGSTFANEIADEVYQNTLTGRKLEDSVRNIRQKINGIYMTSDKAEVNRLVAIAQAGGEDADEAVEVLHRVYATDRAGRNMRRYAKQIVHDSLAQFDAKLAIAGGKEIETEKWTYFGSLVEDSRDICVRLMVGDLSGKSYTEEQINKIWESNAWSGKAEGDPLVVRGGYNCRHLWRPAFEDEDEIEAADAAPEAPPIPVKKVAKKKTAKKKAKKVTKKQALEDLNKLLADGANDPKYIRGSNGLPYTRFRALGRKSGQTNNARLAELEGKATLGSMFDTETIQMLETQMIEVNGYAKTYGIPPLRGIQSNQKGRAIASMGDGMLEVNGKYYPRWSKASRTSLVETQSELERLNKEYDVLYEGKAELYDAYLGSKTRENAKAYNAQIDKLNRLSKKIQGLEEVKRDQNLTASIWQHGDNPDTQPHNVFEYFTDPADRARNTTLHEFAHHIHQSFGVKTSSDLESPILEKWAASLNNKVYPSKYAKANPKEWFAESFAAVKMGKEDLVDKRFVRFINQLEKEGSSMAEFEGFVFR